MQRPLRILSVSRRPFVLALLVSVAAVAALWVLGGNKVENWLVVSADQFAALQSAVTAHRGAAVAAYLGAYIAFVSVSLPGAIWLSIFAGFLFGFWTGFGVGIVGGCLGATFAYLLGHYLLGRWTRIRAAKHHGLIEKNFTQHAFNYLLVLRLMPGLPFVVVNLAVAALKVRLVTYISATLIGMAPSTAAHVAIGASLGEIVAARGPIRSADLSVSPTIALAMIAFALMAAMPIALRHFGKQRKS